MKPVYLDYNATTPIAKEVADAMLPFLYTDFGNPSSAHSYGVKAKLAVEKARSQVAGLIGCNASEIVFTSGGTESNNYAIKGVAFANCTRGNHIITSAIEHPAVLEVYKFLEKNGFDISIIPVDENGTIKIDELKAAIRHDTILISVMHANNEVGTIQPIKEIAEIAKLHNIIMHTDAAQSLGKVAVNVNESGIDLLSIAGHKLYAPKGVGALYIRKGVTLEKLIHGANHEQNRRAGTENVLEIAGLGQAAEIAKINLQANIAHYSETRDYLQKLLTEAFPSTKINGNYKNRLPNTLSISFKKIEANTLIGKLKNVAASAGAACHTENISISSVLKAMNIPIDFAMGTIRLSTGRETTIKDVEFAAQEILNQVMQLQKQGN